MRRPCRRPSRPASCPRRRWPRAWRARAAGRPVLTWFGGCSLVKYGYVNDHDHCLVRAAGQGGQGRCRSGPGTAGDAAGGAVYLCRAAAVPWDCRGTATGRWLCLPLLNHSMCVRSWRAASTTARSPCSSCSPTGRTLTGEVESVTFPLQLVANSPPLPLQTTRARTPSWTRHS